MRPRRSSVRGRKRSDPTSSAHFCPIQPPCRRSAAGRFAGPPSLLRPRADHTTWRRTSKEGARAGEDPALPSTESLFRPAALLAADLVGARRRAQHVRARRAERSVDRVDAAVAGHRRRARRPEHLTEQTERLRRRGRDHQRPRDRTRLLCSAAERVGRDVAQDVIGEVRRLARRRRSSSRSAPRTGSRLPARGVGAVVRSSPRRSPYPPPRRRC